MRVIAGSARRLLLKTVDGMETRPTTDRIKETLFNMLQNDLYGARFLDLFAGSGAIGIEALSRGAKEAVFVDKGDGQISCIRENLKTTHLEEKARVMSADVTEAVRRLDRDGKSFDFIFMDAAKGQYQAFLPHCLRLLPVGGLLIVDDVLQGGTIAQTRFSVPRRQRTIHKRLRNFLWEITHHDALETSIIPIGDGVALCYKKKEIIPETKTEGETKNAE